MGMNGQLVLPCCAQAPSKGCEWIAERYPVTAEELVAIPPGVRLARFMNDKDCADCPYGPFDHTVGWKYHSKVCLRDMQRRKLWKPEDEHWYRVQQEEKLAASRRRFRVFNLAAKESWEGEADSAEEAVRTAGRNCVKTLGGAGWDMKDCRVTQYTGLGWGKPRD